MTKAFEILRKEHEQVLKVLDKLENNLNENNLSSAKKNIKLLEEEFDKHSLYKEEKILFPEIEKFIPRDGGPTGVMITEHKELIELMRNFNKLLEEKNLSRLNETGMSIINILREHINKEDNMLFMIADMHLSEKQKKSVLERFKKIDEKKR